MDQNSQPRRVKATGADANRAGTRHATIKPHKRTEATVAKRTIEEFVANLKSGSVKQTYWGATLTKNDAAIRKSFALAEGDDLYLLLNVASQGTALAGLLLSETGIHLSDGRGGTYALSWKEFAASKVAYQRGTLIIGQSGVTSTDGQTLVTLLQQIQTKIK